MIIGVRYRTGLNDLTGSQYDELTEEEPVAHSASNNTYDPLALQTSYYARVAKIQDTSEQPTMTGSLFTLKNKIQEEILTSQYRSIPIQNKDLNNPLGGLHSRYRFQR